MEEVIIKKLNRGDAKTLAKAFAKSQREDFKYYPRSATEKFLKIWNEKYFRSNKKIFVVATAKNKVVGYVIGRGQWADTGLGIIEWVWVQDGYRGRGIARIMFEEAEKLYLKTGHHKICLEADNPKTWYVYEKLGFVNEGLAKNHAWKHDEYRYGKALAK